jgi:LPS export ABC transporter protein LptC
VKDRLAWVLLMVVAGAGIAWFLSRSEEVEPENRAATNEQPGYYLKNATLSETGSDGRLRLRVAATRADQQPQDGSVLLTDIRVQYHQQTGAQAGQVWFLDAAQGLLPEDRVLVQLQGNVHMTARSVTRPLAAVIETEKLALDTQRDIATTREPVVIELGGHSVYATGMRAELMNDRLQLESKVHGSFTR